MGGGGEVAVIVGEAADSVAVAGGGAVGTAVSEAAERTAVWVASEGLPPVSVGTNVAATSVNWAMMVSAAAVCAEDWSIGGASVEAGRLHATRIAPNTTDIITKETLLEVILVIPFKIIRCYFTNPII